MLELEFYMDIEQFIIAIYFLAFYMKYSIRKAYKSKCLLFYSYWFFGDKRCFL